MNEQKKPSCYSRPLITNLFHWKNIAAIAAAITIAASFYRYMDLLHSGAVVAYLLYPASIGCLALLLYTRVYTQLPEIRLFGAFFAWVLVVIALNMNRADGALSTEWFHSLCATSFLCFSLPYAFESTEQPRVVSFLAWFTVFIGGALSALSLYFVATGRIIDINASIEGVLGIGADNRLGMFCHPNTAASICGIGIVLSVYLCFTLRSKRLRFVLLFPFVLFVFALALTDSRTGILSTALALGFEVFFILNARSFRASKKLLRSLLAIVIATACMALFYQGNAWIRQGYNTLASRATIEKAAVAELAEPTHAANGSAPPQAPSTEVSNRGLSNFDNFNGRTAIWSATLKGLFENPSILFTGTTPLIAGQTMTPYFPKEAPRGLFHNSFIAVLVSFGLPGLLLILAFIALLFVRSLRLITRNLYNEQQLPARLLTSVLIFTLAESTMEQFLFVDGMPSLVWVWFLLAAGFTFCFSREAPQAPAD